MYLKTNMPDELYNYFNAGKSTRDILKFGHKRSVVEFWSKVFHLGEESGPPEGASESCHTKVTGDETVVTTTSVKIKTQEQAIKRANIDMKIFMVDRCEINSWETTMGMDKTGTGKPETYTNFQVKVYLKRKSPEHIGIAEFAKVLKDVTPRKAIPKPKKLKRKPQVMAEIALYDIHFGMLAWKAQCGQNYDLRIAERLYLRAIDHFLKSLSGYEVDKFLMPIGHDFLHINDQFNETPAGKNKLDVDGRISKIMKTASQAVFDAVERMAKVAPVELIWVPGNHDPLTSLFLIQMLEARYRNTKHVTVDDSENERKYRTYGPSLIGFNHAHKIRPNRLPFVMLEDCPVEFAKAKHREWHIGHRHTMEVLEFKVGMQLHSMRVRTIPTLCRHDEYAHGKGFPKSGSSAECYLWHKKDGYHGHLNAPAEVL